MGLNSLQITDVTTSSEAGAHNLIKSGYLSDLDNQQECDKALEASSAGAQD
jgi:hypothetical protein